MTSSTPEGEKQQGEITRENNIIIISDKYRKYLRPQTPAEYEAMRESIKQNGQQIVGVKNQNNVLIDGHHRYKACQELGIPFKCETRYFENEEVEREFIDDVNLKKRHYTEFELAQHVLTRKAELVEIAKRNMSLGGKGVSVETPLGRVYDQLAKYTGGMISDTTIFRTDNVLQAVNENPTTYSNLLRDLQDKKIKVSKAYNIVKKDQKRAKVKAEIEEATKGLKLPEKVILLNKDTRRLEELTEIKDNSVDLIITDPPYGKEYLDCYEGLAKFASKKLREGGCLVFFFGRHLIFEIGKIFEIHAPNLTFGDIFAVVHEGRGDIFRPINTIIKWKPMLLFVKGNRRLTNSLIEDLIYSKKPDKDQHEWAQSNVEAEFLVKNLTESEFSLVVDPFLGSGEFAIPVIEMKRYFIGVEIDKQVFEDAKKYITSKTGIAISTEAGEIKK